MKILDISQILKSFEGKPIKEKVGSEESLTLKTVILTYLSAGQSIGLSGNSMGDAYSAGMKIGVVNKKVELEQREYDVIKDLCEKGKIKDDYIFNLIVQQQAINMINEAENVKDVKIKKDDKVK